MQKYFVSCLIVVGLAWNAHAALNVIATTADLGEIAREIGGQFINLNVLAKPTEDPHSVEPKPTFLRQINKADLIIEGGAELEAAWLHSLLEQGRNAKLAYGAKGHLHGSDGIELLEVPLKLDRSQGDVHSMGNPHYLIDPVNAKTVADHITRKFCEFDPKNCGDYQEKNRTFAQRIDQKLVEWEKILAPHKGSRIVAYHNSWPYFARRFGLRIDLFLEPKPGIPPTPSHLASVIGTMKKEKVRVIFLDPYVNRKTAERVAEETGAKIVEVSHFPGAIRGVEKTYIDLMDHLVKSTAKALAE